MTSHNISIECFLNETGVAVDAFVILDSKVLKVREVIPHYKLDGNKGTENLLIREAKLCVLSKLTTDLINKGLF